MLATTIMNNLQTVEETHNLVFQWMDYGLKENDYRTGRENLNRSKLKIHVRIMKDSYYIESFDDFLQIPFESFLLTFIAQIFAHVTYAIT